MTPASTTGSPFPVHGIVSELYDRYAGVKKRELNSRSPNTRPILEREEWDQRNGEDDNHIKKCARTSVPRHVESSQRTVFPLNLPTTTSSTISKISNKIVNAAALARIE